MSLLEKLRNFIEEPPPKFAFEIGPAGLAVWQQGRDFQFAAIEGLDREPDSAMLESLLRRATPPVNGNKRRPAALILPDSCARLTLLDFDSFPRKADEQLSLIRFRLKRSVPFDVDTAVVRYLADSRQGNSVSVVAAAISIEKLAPYEAALRNAGFHPGFITLSSLSTANLAAPNTAILKLSASHLTLSFFDATRLRLYRGLELESPSLSSILDVLDPTLAYLEDELRQKPHSIAACGLEDFTEPLSQHLNEHWRIPCAPLRSAFSAQTVDEYNAGLFGYLAAQGVQ
jgi:type IV pilus assembly protein PilM